MGAFQTPDILDQCHLLTYKIGKMDSRFDFQAQEFFLRWSSNGEGSTTEIVRQQWNFSPPESIREIEKYRVELSGVAVLEWSSIPMSAVGLVEPPWRNSVCPDARHFWRECRDSEHKGGLVDR
jgi:hypothetical protein